MRDPEAPIDFALFPNAVCEHPPIKHRHAGSYWRRGLTPMQFYVLGGIVIASRAALDEQRHRQAFAKTAAAIRKEVKTGKKFFDAKEAADAYGWGAPPKGRAIQRAGSNAYNARKKSLRKVAPDEVAFEITPRRLLCFSGLTVDSDSYRAVDAALKRLCRPVGAGGCEMPAPLRDWEIGAAGKLRLSVDGAWLPASRFKRVWWPPPKRSAAALALYLFAQFTDTRATYRGEVTEQWFADRIGLDPGMSTGARRRAINAAFGVLNDYMRDLPDALVKRMWGRKRRVEIPMAYTCEPITGGKIRVVAELREKVYDAAAAEARPHGKKKTVKRKPLRRAEGVGDFASGRQKSVGDFASTQDKVWGSSHPSVGDFASNHDCEPREEPVLQGFRSGWGGPI